MSKKMKIISAVCTTAAFLTAVLYIIYHGDVLFTLAITLGTMAYHFCMRLLVGVVINSIYHNHMDYTKKWFCPLPFEERLYKKLQVKKWKNRMPAYNPELFSLEKHTLEEIIRAMCQAEVVHEVIVVLSFLPLLAALKFGSFGVFLVTSLLAALFDMMFVMMQRYNRPRMVKLAEKYRKNKGSA